jgi:hypothetical protein
MVLFDVVMNLYVVLSYVQNNIYLVASIGAWILGTLGTTHSPRVTLCIIVKYEVNFICEY